MGNITSMTRNDNHDGDAFSRINFKTCDNGGLAPWSDLNHDVLYLVMMKLGVIDFVSFSGVCKSWRLLALSNWNKFMASTPPMPMQISSGLFKKKCYLEDIEGRKFKTILTHFANMTYVGLTCGYLIFIRKKFKTRDFWLVNPITRHELHFPNVPIHIHRDLSLIKAILVFSPSISGWVFIFLNIFGREIWFSIADKGAWNHVSITFPIHDLHAFKGKIYTIDKGCRVYEMKLHPEPKLTFLEIKNFMKPHFVYPKFVSSGKNFYVMDLGLKDGLEDMYKVMQLDFGEMKWVMPKKTIEKYAFFVSSLNDSVVIKPKPWAYAWSEWVKIVISLDKSRKCRFFVARMWYFPHECMNDNLID